MNTYDVEKLLIKVQELEDAASYIEEGVLVLDDIGKVRLINKSFKEIIGKKDIEGKYYWEILGDEDVTALIKTAIKEEKTLSEEVTFNDNIYTCRVNLLPDKKRVVVVFYNITEFKKLEKIKRDFVSNVSHELRTPLTAIKGYLETLADEEIDPLKKRYINIMEKNVDRLTNIVKDLLLLSKLEDRDVEMEVECVDLVSLVENLISIFKLRAQEKGIVLNFLVDEKIPVIRGDSFKLEQLFINLIDNAIKYTEKGSITISLQKVGNNIRIIIKDTGIGIPEKDLNRVFERFYVVDKSRSRQLGGTGLGLSIVKHIVLLHKGRIHVKSELGKGTEFIIDIPIPEKNN